VHSAWPHLAKPERVGMAKRKFHKISWSFLHARADFEVENLDVLLSSSPKYPGGTGIGALYPPPGRRGFPEYPEKPHVVIGKDGKDLRQATLSCFILIGWFRTASNCCSNLSIHPPSRSKLATLRFAMARGDRCTGYATSYGCWMLLISPPSRTFAQIETGFLL
jgi:hypothetical protein